MFKKIIAAGIAASLVVAFAASCKKEQKAKIEKKKYPNPNFEQVASKLDPGGNFYMYISAKKGFSSLSKKLDSVEDMFLKNPKLSQENKDSTKKAFNLAKNLIKGSGLQEIKGFGMSSFPLGKELYRGRIVVYHDKGKDQGMLWKMLGEKPHALDSLKLLPKDTVAAAFKDLNANIFWKWLKKNFQSSQLPKLTEGIDNFENELKTKHKIDLDKLLASFDRIGFMLTLDEKKKAMIPIPQPMTIAEPALAIVLHIKDNYIFDLLKQKIPCTLKEDKNAEKMLLNIPIPPLPLNFHPLFAKSKDLLIIASNETIVDKMLEAHEKGNGLIATEDFKKISENIELKGNGFKYQTFRRTNAPQLEISTPLSTFHMALLSSGTQTKAFS
jgi:hypothetical protein